jgi:hypothetical protein
MIEGSFRPSHHVPRGGMLTWDAPDPNRAASNRLDSDLAVQVLEETTGWARIRCSNGWETWVAASELVPIPFRPTHTVPAGGLDARPAPEPSRLPDDRLAAGLPVEVQEESYGWARVRCSNGWETWVDGRGLVPARSTGPAFAGGPLNPIALAAIGGPALLVILGSVLAWYSILSSSVNAWDLEIVSLFTHDESSIDLKTGPVLLVLALATLVLVVVRLPRNGSMIAFGGLGGAVFVIGMAGVVAWLDFAEPRPDLGIGMILTIVAGLAIAVAGILVPMLKPRA